MLEEEHATYLQNLAIIRRNLENARNFLAMASIELERMEKLGAQNPPGEKPLLADKPKSEPEPVKVEEPLIINDEWSKVLYLMNHGTENLFITGEAGTGKSTLLKHFTDNCSRNVAIVAPTGVAALRVMGETIHRFFGFGAHALENDDIEKVSDSRRKKYRELDILVIDEISMVRADLMDAIDKFLRLNGRLNDQPFGGCRLIMFGDLFQLPPVAKEKQEKQWLDQRYGTETPYFFHAECWRDKPPLVYELTTIFRQKDNTFTTALNAIRRGNVAPDHLKLINDRVIPTFKPPAGELWLTLTTTNASADNANQKMLRSLTTTSKTFEATVIGDFDLNNAPTDEYLELKVGAVVMFIRNERKGSWVNGTLGKVTSVAPLMVEVNGVNHEVESETWESIYYEFDEAAKKLTKRIKGEFCQIPLKLASAITIHKGQGMTYDRVIIDMGSGAFASGQTYVALSRCRTLEGMVLRKAIEDRDLIVSTEVQAFMSGKPIARPKPTGQLTMAI